MDHPSLPERPSAQALTVEDILEHARRGRLRVPRFQTALRWKASHVVELFDSIVRGFPIGGLLLWKRRAPDELQSFGPVTMQAPETADALYVVDGQQRITALVAALSHPGAPPLGDTYAVWVDLATSAFEVHRRQPGPTWLPLNVLGNRSKLHQWSRTVELGDATDALVERAFELESVIMRYPVPAYVVREASEQALRLIFARVNNAGVPLREDQVFEALFGAAHGPAKPLEAMGAALHHETRFGTLGEGWLLRCVKAVGGIAPKLSFDERRQASPELMERTRAALRRSIHFLQEEARIPHASVLPYRFPLIVLAKLFDLHPTLEPRDRTLLVRWVWRGALSGEHANSNHATVSATLADVGEDPTASVRRLLDRVPHGVGPPDPMAAWYGQAAASRIFAIVMLLEEPLDPDTQEPISPQVAQGWLESRDLGEIFRPATGRADRPIADRVFNPTRLDLRVADDEVLRHLVIDAEAASHLRQGDADSFVACRAAGLTAAATRWTGVLAAPGESDRPSIRAIVARHSA